MMMTTPKESENMPEPVFKCCRCGISINDFESVNEHVKPTKENNYEVHEVVPIQKCIMCPARNTCNTEDTPRRVNMIEKNIEIKESVCGKSTGITIIKNRDDVDNQKNAKNLYDFLRNNISAKTCEILWQMVKKNVDEMEPYNEYLKKSVEK